MIKISPSFFYIEKLFSVVVRTNSIVEDCHLRSLGTSGGLVDLCRDAVLTDDQVQAPRHRLQMQLRKTLSSARVPQFLIHQQPTHR